jgi:hypothetical protein
MTRVNFGVKKRPCLAEERMDPAPPIPAAGRDATSPAAGGHRPSPPWYGGLVAVLLFGSFGWIICYGLVRAPGLGALGSWNYVIAAGLFLASVVMARWFRPG